MAVVLDILIIAVFAISVFLGWKRGFIKTLTGLVAFAVSIGVALWLSAPIAQWVYDSAVEPTLSAAVEGVQNDAAQSAIQSADTLLAGLPDGVRSLLAASGIQSGDTLVSNLSPDSTGSIADRLVSDIIEPLIVSAIRIIALLVLFLLTNVLASLLLRVVDKIFKLPLLKGINRTLGILPGAVNGALCVLIAVALLQLLSTLGIWVTAQDLQSSVIVSRLSDINPLAFGL